ncbi:MAG: bacterial proteasome activator family protein [Arthrobacter sp.]|uniref:bacterial proteasome activator family protein n=1 Tax=Arthrobacter sp. TaxID=1667 RepID=UPI0034940B42
MSDQQSPDPRRADDPAAATGRRLADEAQAWGGTTLAGPGAETGDRPFGAPDPLAGSDGPRPPERLSGDRQSAGQPDGRVTESFRVTGLVDEPAKVLRIGGMIKQLLAEVKSAPLDELARTHLADIHERSVRELEDGLSPELVEELHRIRLPFGEGETPSEAELRIAQAQLVGWLEGVFHGIQTALAAQQIASQQLAQRIRLREIPPGTEVAPGIVINDAGEPVRVGPPRPGDTAATGLDGGPGQYL